MENNPGTQFDMDKLMQMAKSPAGQQLFAMLKNMEAQSLLDAKKHISEGNISQAQKAVENFLKTAEGKDLLKQLGR